MPLRLLLLAVPLIATGCYSYVPTALEDVAPGGTVRMRISGVEAERLEAIRFTDSRALEGAVVSTTGNELFIDAVIRSVDPLGYTATHTQRLNIPVREVQFVEQRRLDVLKTGIAAGGTAFLLGGAAYVVIFGDLRGQTEFEPVEMGGPRLRLPLLRFTH
jgi:hypothetical protein